MTDELTGSVSKFRFDGLDFAFFVHNPDDAIQRQHAEGRLFDFAELEKMCEHLSTTGDIVDVGANVGNHSVYFAKRFPTLEIYPVEPSGEALSILRRNLALNACANVRHDFLGLALSDHEGEATLQRGGPNNLGGTRLVPAAAAGTGPQFSTVPLTTGDAICQDLHPQLLKIDVEGAELRVLAGFEATIARCRPVLFIEIWNDNIPAFERWVDEHAYTVDWIDRHYARMTNYLVTPR